MNADCYLDNACIAANVDKILTKVSRLVELKFYFDILILVKMFSVSHCKKCNKQLIFHE